MVKFATHSAPALIMSIEHATHPTHQFTTLTHTVPKGMKNFHTSESKCNYENHIGMEIVRSYYFHSSVEIFCS